MDERARVPLEAEAHLVGQGVQQQHRLAPGGVDLVPLHRDAGQPAQAEVVDGAELTAVPAPQGGQSNISALDSVLCLK